MGKTVYLVSGYEISEDGMLSLLYEPSFNKYVSIAKSGLARKLMINGYDVYMLGNPNGIRSADFIATRKNMVYYLEGKTFNGTNTLDHLMLKAVCQAEKVVVDIISQTDVKYLTSIIRLAFERNSTLNEVIFFKGSRMIVTTRRQVEGKQFEHDFKKVWVKTK